MKILITGANGFLGKKLSLRLLDQGHELYLLVRNRNRLNAFMDKEGEGYSRQIHILEGDVTEKNLGLNMELVKSLTGEIDAIYHGAALLSFDEKDRDRTYQVNVEGTKNVLEFSLEISCCKVFYISTAYTVGQETSGSETLYSMDRSFVNPYEASKCEAEHLVYGYSNKLETVILRPGIIIGDSKTGEADTNFGLYGFLKGVKILKKRADRRQGDKKCRIFLDPEVAQNFVPVDYVIEVLEAALFHSRNRDIFNITNPNPPRQSEILSIVKEILDFPQLQMHSLSSSDDMSNEEKAFYDSMSIFHSYFQRTIDFPTGHTERMLTSAGLPLLNMDREVLKRIIEGFLTDKARVPS
ncbi:SDR family NAD(P)-dependent oxidoreductase [Bacillus sp. ISL-47]|uniref:SDR family NAD(P)-dependent oxidoreductase n=1 Tax=Bacillus sp. ISL-47 TaxID=2819130 RepID=UPI001BE50701|nr:SDR family NAD(P)-dependent oxidoreductase [Bacillus sp. ISL-47]MBT2687721.1 SDR family NAD(P)-dependent oxidoreductase [Bacillus sp. ISL-47]MBT2710775.1 SDR family NAD(P)-dependent oxidoreductase [Pseudomonas sp. ISL-84]